MPGGGQRGVAAGAAGTRKAIAYFCELCRFSELARIACCARVDNFEHMYLRTGGGASCCPAEGWYMCETSRRLLGTGYQVQYNLVVYTKW